MGYTVIGCEDAAEDELVAAAKSTEHWRRVFHLNRAAAFSSCCEEAKRSGALMGLTSFDNLLCQPHFVNGSAVDVEEDELVQAITKALRLADARQLTLVGVHLAQALTAATD